MSAGKGAGMDVKRRLARRFLVAVLFASFVRAYGLAAHPALARGRPGSVSLPPPRSRPAERVRLVLGVPLDIEAEDEVFSVRVPLLAVA